MERVSKGGVRDDGRMYSLSSWKLEFLFIELISS